MDRQKINMNGRKCNKNTSGSNFININNHNNNIKYGQRNNGLEWTNETHSKFLSSMEASFVHNMLEKSCNFNFNINTTATSKLDRFVPDISESTLDVRSSVHLSNEENKTSNKHKKARRSRKMVHDQVVPQFEEKECAKGHQFDLNK